MSVEADFLMGAVYKAASAVGNSSVPFEGYVASGWNYMTDNYSKFTIATVFSGILHEVHLCMRHAAPAWGFGSLLPTGIVKMGTNILVPQ